MSVNDILLVGRGQLHAAKYTNETLPTTFTALGNAPVIDYNFEGESKEHFTVLSDWKSLDKLVKLTKGYTISFSLEEITGHNLAMFMQGEYTTPGAGTDGRVDAMTNENDEYYLKFVPNNPDPDAPQWEFHFYRCSLEVSGDAHSLISEEPQALSLTARGLKVYSLGSGDHPYSDFMSAILVGSAT